MCVICDDPRVADINLLLRNGVPLQQVEKNYGLGHGTLHRHVAGGHHQNDSVQAVDTPETGLDTSILEELDPMDPVDDTDAEISAPILAPIMLDLTPAWAPLTVVNGEGEQEASRTPTPAPLPAAHREPEPQPAVDMAELRALEAFSTHEYLPLSAEFADKLRVFWQALGWPELFMGTGIHGGDQERGMAYLADLRDKGITGLWLGARNVIMGRYQEVMRAAAEATEA